MLIVRAKISPAQPAASYSLPLATPSLMLIKIKLFAHIACRSILRYAVCQRASVCSLVVYNNLRVNKRSVEDLN